MSVPLTHQRSGFALITVLVALAVLTTLGVAITALGAVEYRTAVNHRSATRAVLLADAGITHALAVLRGPLAKLEYSDVLVGADGEWGTEDDGYLAGFDLSEDDELPVTGIASELGHYTVRIVNDAGDPSGDPSVDSNNEFLAICQAHTRDGGVAEVRALLAARPFPAIATNGNLILPGDPTVTGPCAGVHANGNLIASGHPTVDGQVSATGSIDYSGTITDSYGNPVPMLEDEPEVVIPDYNPMDYCDGADYFLSGGYLVTYDDEGEVETSVPANGSKPMGWQWDSSSNTYTLFAKNAVPGTVCSDANVKVNGSLGGVGDTFAISILADGSVQLNGTPVVRPTHPEGILIMASGDVQAGGNSAGGTPFYEGLLYSGSQCKVNGNPVINGHVLCHDGVNLAGQNELTDENKVNGNPTIQHNCNGFLQRTAIVSWWEVRTQ